MSDFGSDIEMSRVQGRFRIARDLLLSLFCILPILLFTFMASQPVVDTARLRALFKTNVESRILSSVSSEQSKILTPTPTAPIRRVQHVLL